MDANTKRHIHEAADAQLSMKHNGRHTKRHKAQNIRRHKKAHNLGNPLLKITKNTLISRGRSKKSAKICTVRYHWLCQHSLISMGQENVPPGGILAELLPVKLYGTSHQVLQRRLVHQLLLGDMRVYVKYHVVVYVIVYV
jgi:hypothetical protein